MKNEKPPIFGYFIAALILGGFVGGIGFGFAHKLEQSIICVGVIVTTIALLSVSNGINIRNCCYIFMIIFGLALIILPVCLLYAKAHPDFAFPSAQAVVLYGGLATIFLAGIALIIGSFTMRLYIQKYCTATVVGKCIDLEKRQVSRRMGGSYSGHNRPYVYRPTWEYTYNGGIYKYKDTEATNIDVPEIGGEYELKINPDKPEEAFREVSPTRIGSVVMGILCIINALVALYFLFR